MPQLKKKVPQSSFTTAVLKIVLLYAALASLWILASDTLVGLVFTEPAQIRTVSTLKGWAFVAVTSLLLFVQLRRLAFRLSDREAEETRKVPDFVPIGPMLRRNGPEKEKSGGLFSRTGIRQVVLPFSLLAVVIAFAGLGGIVYTARQQKEKEIALLQTVADLKAGQVSNWLAERNADAEMIHSNVLLSDFYQRWQRTGDKAGRAQLWQRMEAYRKGALYHGVLLLDHRGETVLSVGDESPQSTPQLRATVVKAVGEGRVLNTNLYRTEDHQQAWTHLDFVAPLPATQGRPGMAVALLVDPKQFLYRDLQSWPIPSASAETVLFRKDNGQVLYLNELRHGPGLALKQRMSPQEKDVLSVQVIQGRAGPGSTVEGVDYRQVPVLGVVRAIPGTDWFLIAKLDKSELYAPVKWDAVWIVLAAILAQFISAVLLFLLHKHRALQVSELQRLQQEEKLRALQLLDAVTENSPDAVYAKDRAGHYLLFNREVCRMTNTSREEALGRDDRALFPPAEAEAIMANDRKVMEANQVMTCDEVVTTTDGEVTLMSTKGPLRDGDGRVVGMFGISRDITGRKRAEDALRESEKHFRALIENGSDIISELDERGTILYESPSVERALGHRQGDLLGKSVFEYIHPDDSAVVTNIFSQGMANLGATYSVEFRFRHHDGTWRLLESAGKFFVRTPGALGVIVNSRDITERKRTEAQLREAEAFIQDILTTVDEAIVVIDRDYRILTANTAYCTQAGKVLATIIGTHCYETSHHTTRPCHKLEQSCACNRTFETGEPVVNVHTHADAKGNLVYKEVKTFATKGDAGEVTSVIEVINDITEKTALENQLRHAQKMEGIGTLAGGIAHDFNNILSAIIGYGHITLMKMPKDDPLRLNIEHLLESADRAAALTQSLLMFSRKQLIDRRQLDLNTILKKVEKFLVRVIGEDVAVRLALAEGALNIFADAGQLEQVFMNLATNARDAMPNGGSLMIETSITELDGRFATAHGYGKAGTYALVSATDTGVGMNEETRKKIFEPFFTTKEVGKGTGLGLAMVYGIIKQHEGFINVYSEPGKGTTFRIYLPLTGEAAADEQRSVSAEYPNGGTETILVAEDDPSVRKLTAFVLEQMGYTVITANDGEEAVTKFRENKSSIRLLLFDIMMPKKSGREAYEEIRKSAPDVPVLFASGYSADMLRQKALVEDGAAVVSKPLSPQVLLRKVREALGRTGTGS